ncbi:MAG: hypothetical protein ISS83_01830 [Candidatus Pacebacteria bacterium]|nr:hypothetical protein [Candidatus Paceibacterota bacterium]
MGNLKKFTALSVEKKLLIIFVIVCLALPFSFSRSPIEILSHSLPLFVYFQGTVSYWLISGKPLWQASLACYGISTVQLFCIYFGTFGIMIFLKKTLNWLKKQLEKGLVLPFSKNQMLILKKRTGYQALNSFANDKKQKFTVWLGEQNTWIILLFLLLPLPVTDIIAAAALGVKGLKYGHWYLAAVNLPHIFLIVYLLSLGINLFFF